MSSVVTTRIRTGRSSGSPRLLIVRLSAIGDCVQTLPLAAALRRHFPEAQITWAVERSSAELIAACPAVDEVLVVPRGFTKSPRVLWEIRQELHSRRFDVTLDPQGLTKSGIVAWLSGARRRIGFARPAAREINPWLQTEWLESLKQHRVERYLELLQPLGIPTAHAEFCLCLPPAAERSATDLLRQTGLARGYAVLNPGAGWDSKRWMVERYAEVARHLARRGVRAVVTWGGQRELGLAEQIVARSEGTAVLAPPTTLLELAAVLKGARFVVGSDTGPIHLAAALGTRCIALFGSSLAGACGPYGQGNVCLQAAYDDSPGRKRAGADNWAMRAISVEMVCEACDSVLDRAGDMSENTRKVA